VKNYEIKHIRLGRNNDIVYASLYCDNELIISATLDYVVNALNERDYLKQKKDEEIALRKPA